MQKMATNLLLRRPAKLKHSLYITNITESSGEAQDSLWRIEKMSKFLLKQINTGHQSEEKRKDDNKMSVCKKRPSLK